MGWLINSKLQGKNAVWKHINLTISSIHTYIHPKSQIKINQEKVFS